MKNVTAPSDVLGAGCRLQNQQPIETFPVLAGLPIGSNISSQGKKWKIVILVPLGDLWFTIIKIYLKEETSTY